MSELHKSGSPCGPLFAELCHRYVLMALKNLRAVIAGSFLGGIVLLGIVIGSLGGIHFDAELTFYAIGSILAASAIGYRFALWAERPPTRRYLSRGYQFLREGRQRPKKTIKRSLSIGTEKFVGQGFIRRRSIFRWIMHLCLSGGCTLAFAVTFPLVFGWVHFQPFLGDATRYEVRVLGVAVDSFSVHSSKAWLMFNLLNIAGVIVVVGVVMALYRRLTDPGERATQSFSEDFVPLLLIMAVATTGLALTVSYKWFGGDAHGILAIIHLICVLGLLFYIPFGKLFHMFQRICSFCVGWYKQEGAAGIQAHCARCSQPFASRMHIDDLKVVLDQLGFDYRYGTDAEAGHYQEICPACRRRLIALNQGQAIGR